MKIVSLITGICLGAILLPAGSSLAAGNPEQGAKKNAMCIGCHGIVGYRTAFPEVYGVPKIGNQYQEYIVSALHAYRDKNRSHPSMQAIAESLTDQDIEDLAAYYGAAKQ